MTAPVAEQAAARADDEPRGPLFWTGVIVGWAVIAYAVAGIVSSSDATRPPELARWVVGGLLVHDVVWAPVATVLAVVLLRRPAWWARPLGVAAAVTALLAVFALPLVLRFGIRHDNPSALPRDYGTNLAVLVAAVWLIAGAVVLGRGLHRRFGS